MSSIDPRECERRVQDAAAYVLGALSEHELESYSEHLGGCVECAAEVAVLQPAADSLALGVARVEAPPDLRARLMAVVGGEAELLHAAGHEADLPARRRMGWRARLAPALGAATALAAGLAIGALAIGGSTNTVTRTQTIEAAVVAPGHHATAVLRKAGSHVVLVLAGMPAPPPGRIYEVWLERGAQAPQPTDVLFSVTHSGGGSVGVPDTLAGVSKVLVTAEPLGGSPKPTREPVIVASI
ncbi:MAG TPA: anti-sigma factor [Solirubrobacteraceae bacterium]|jgi:anti-sigma-K factor RskA|nr:anti-sigma factor [Solirubrobacteraceae bacterium]